MKALLLVDIQNDFCTGGSLAVPKADEVVAVANTLMASEKYPLVVATKDFHPKNHSSFASNNEGAEVGQVIQVGGISQMMWPDHCVEDEVGSEFHPQLNVDRIDEVVYKGVDERVDSYSAFFDNNHDRSTGLSELLRSRGIDELTICGLATDYCVKATAEDALDEGFKVEVIKEGCRAVDPDNAVSEDVFSELISKGCRCI